MKTLGDIAKAVDRDVSAVRRKARKEGIEMQWAIAPGSHQRVLVLMPAAERELMKHYPTELKVLPAKPVSATEALAALEAEALALCFHDGQLRGVAVLALYEAVKALRRARTRNGIDARRLDVQREMARLSAQKTGATK